MVDFTYGRKIVLRVFFIVMLAAVLIGCSSNDEKEESTSKSSRSVVKDYYKAMAKYDFDKYSESTIYNKTCLKKLDVWDDDWEERLKNIEDQYETMTEDSEDNNIKITVKIEIQSVTTYKSKDEEFDWYMEYLEELYDFDTDAIEKVDVAETWVETITNDDGDKETESGTLTTTVIRVDGNWYVVPYCLPLSLLEYRYGD